MQRQFVGKWGIQQFQFQDTSKYMYTSCFEGGSKVGLDISITPNNFVNHNLFPFGCCSLDNCFTMKYYSQIRYKRDYFTFQQIALLPPQHHQHHDWNNQFSFGCRLYEIHFYSIFRICSCKFLIRHNFSICFYSLNFPLNAKNVLPLGTDFVNKFLLRHLSSLLCQSFLIGSEAAWLSNGHFKRMAI